VDPGTNLPWSSPLLGFIFDLYVNRDMGYKPIAHLLCPGVSDAHGDIPTRGQGNRLHRELANGNFVFWDGGGGRI